MTTDPEKKERAVYSPSVRTRLLWWFGIYIAAQLPLVFSASPFWAFPAGLAAFFLIRSSGPDFSNWLIPFGYALYLLHLTISLVVRRRQAFLILMVVLIVVASLNLWSCEVLPTLGRVP